MHFSLAPSWKVTPLNLEVAGPIRFAGTPSRENRTMRFTLAPPWQGTPLSQKETSPLRFTLAPPWQGTPLSQKEASSLHFTLAPLWQGIPLSQQEASPLRFTLAPPWQGIPLSQQEVSPLRFTQEPSWQGTPLKLPSASAIVWHSLSRKVRNTIAIMGARKNEAKRTMGKEGEGKHFTCCVRFHKENQVQRRKHLSPPPPTRQKKRSLEGHCNLMKNVRCGFSGRSAESWAAFMSHTAMVAAMATVVCCDHDPKVPLTWQSVLTKIWLQAYCHVIHWLK